MSGYKDLKEVDGLCYYCNNIDECSVYGDWVRSDFVGHEDVECLFNVLKCKNYIPDKRIDINRCDFIIELAERRKEYVS